MANRLVAVDDNFNLPPEVQQQLSANFEAEFQELHDEAVTSAATATSKASDAAVSATAAASSATAAQNAAADAEAPTDGMVFNLVNDEGSDTRNALDTYYSPEADVYRREVLSVIPFKFPGYSDVVASQATWSFLHPQTLTYLEDRLYILYGAFNASGNGVGSWVSVHDADTAAYIQGFGMAQAFGESIEVLNNGSTTTLYMPSGANLLAWNITSLPAEGTILNSPTSTYAVNVFDWAMYDKGTWTIVNRGPSDGPSRRHLFTKWDSTLANRIGSLNFDPNHLWNLTDYTAHVKAQSITPFRGGYAVGYGGAWRVGNPVTPTSLVGIKLFDDAGNVVFSSLSDPGEFLTVLNAAGVPGTVIENEGVTQRNGELHALWVTRAWNDAGSDVSGIVITRELSGSVLFTNTGRTTTTVPNISRTSQTIFTPEAGALRNPLDGSAMGSFDSIIEMMRSSGMYQYQAYTTGATITDIYGATITSGAYLTVKTANYYSWLVTVESLIGTDEYWISGSKGSLTQTIKSSRYLSYTPTLGGVTLGTGGTLTGRYRKDGTTVHWEVQIILGTGGSVTGYVNVSMPVNRRSSATYQSVGTATLKDASGGLGGWRFWNAYCGASPDTSTLSAPDGTLVASTVPWTWANGDTIFISGTYECAA